MNVWAVANQKGGVGKTTTAVTLGGALSRRGFRTLLVDADPHGSLSVYFGHDPDTQPKGVYQLFQHAGRKERSDVEGLIQQTGFDLLDLMPAATAMATLDRQSGGHGGMGLVLVRALQALQDRYDFALIDCPPLLGVLMVNALAACEHLIVPVQTEFLALKGLERIVHTVEMVLRSRTQAFEYTIVPTMFDRRTRASNQSLAALQEQYGASLWNGVIPVDTQFREASQKGIPLSLLTPASRGAAAYEALLEALMAGMRPTREAAAVW